MRSSTRPFRFPALTLMVLGLLASGAGPATAAPKAPLDYVAVGDSYASGFGAGSYTNACGQSPLGLPSILDSKKQVELTADATCAGAKAGPDTPQVTDLPEQLANLESTGAIGSGTDLVTLSAGGNDVGFGTIVGACATQLLTVCAQFVADAEATARTTLTADLNTLYADVEAAAPNAQVVVTGYPHLFSPEFGTPGPLTADAQQLFNDGTDTLNSIIRELAEAHGFEYVDVVQKFDGHGVGSPNSWITFTGFQAPDDLHPTAEGYKAGYYPAIRSNVNFSQLQRR